jgi:hypothetical protein
LLIGVAGVGESLEWWRILPRLRKSDGYARPAAHASEAMCAARVRFEILANAGRPARAERNGAKPDLIFGVDP